MGDATVGHDPLPDELGDVFADLREAYVEDPSDEIASAHLSVMTTALRELRSQRARDRRTRRRVVTVCAAVGVTAALTVPASLAAASGGLPGPLQNLVAKAAAPFGIEVPTDRDGPHDGPDDRPTSEPVTRAPAPVGSSAPSDDPEDGSEQHAPAPSVLRAPAEHDPVAGSTTTTTTPRGTAGENGSDERPDTPPGLEDPPVPPPTSSPSPPGNHGKPETPPGLNRDNTRRPTDLPGRSD
jgi:hypothetical protein